MYKFSKLLKTALVLVGLAMPTAAGAVMIDVQATDVPGFTGGTPTGLNFNIGDPLSVTADPADTWVLGSGPERVINADGFSLATGFTASSFANFDAFGQSFRFGTLVGQIGMGDFFAIGSNFVGTANAAGELSLFNWDSNVSDNSGSISISANINVAAVPLPYALPLFGSAIAFMGFVSRRRSHTA